MSFKKIFIYFSVVPIVLAELNKQFASIKFLPWAHERVNQISFAALIIAGLACLFIIYKNAQSKRHNKFWYAFAGIMAVVFFGYLYLAYQFSQAGF